MKGGQSKVESILAILFVITKGILHPGKKMDGLHLRDRSLNAPLLGEIGKHLDAERHMPTPALAGPVHLLIPDAVLL
jgi:hypothetical protein